MYKIVGADGKEYGPITTGQLRLWIGEGRVNAQTSMRLESDANWKPLCEFPEFAEALGLGQTGEPASAPTASPMASGAGTGRDAALQAVRGPGIALLVTAIIGLVMVGLGLVINILTLSGVHIMTQQVGDPNVQKLFNTLGGSLGIVQDIVGGIVGVIVLMGATRMQKLQAHRFAFTASILAMLPCISPCCFLGLPFGIWALVVLNRPEVKSQFS